MKTVCTICIQKDCSERLHLQRRHIDILHMITYYICLSSILCWQVILICYNCTTTFIISVLTLSTVLTCYLCSEIHANFVTAILFWQLWQLFRAGCEGSWLLKQKAVSVRVVRSCMREQINSKQLVQNYIFDVLIVLNVDFCQWPAKVIHLKDNQQSTKFCSYSDSLSSIFLVICLWQSKWKVYRIIHNYRGDNVRSLRWVAVVATNITMMIMAVAPSTTSAMPPFTSNSQLVEW
jgi:hypothetical protein